jgi:hypothetical protein
MTLREIYQSLDTTPPKTAWLKKVAKITHKGIPTVRAWVAGPGRYPDELTQSILAQHLGRKVEELFPKKEQL